MIVDAENDPVLAAVANLRACDVSQRNVRRLRRQCHVMLQAASSTTASSGMADGGVFRRLVCPTLAGLWCVAYVIEILRRAAATYPWGP
jgi:hypothetical protein